MVYKNKVYVTFDADSDIQYFYLMKAWKENESIDFTFNDAHQIHAQGSPQAEEYVKRILRERLDNTKCMVVLVGERTRYMYKYVLWELEQAIARDLPIIVVNINNCRRLDVNLCPPIIRNKMVLHIPFKAKIIKHAIDIWPDYYHDHKHEGHQDMYFEDSVYASMSVD